MLVGLIIFAKDYLGVRTRTIPASQKTTKYFAFEKTRNSEKREQEFIRYYNSDHPKLDSRRRREIEDPKRNSLL